MKIIYEVLDNVIGDIEYKTELGHYHHRARGTIVEISEMGRLKIDFKRHDGKSQIEFKNTFHVDPFIEKTQYQIDSLTERYNSVDSKIIKIAQILDE